MPTAEIRLSSAARKAYEKLGDPRIGKPLYGPLQGHRSLRLGSMRMVYRFEAGKLLVPGLSIAERGRVYRDLDRESEVER